MIWMGAIILAACFTVGWGAIATYYKIYSDDRIKENAAEITEIEHRRSVVRAHAMARAIVRQAMREARISVRYKMINESDIKWDDED